VGIRPAWLAAHRLLVDIALKLKRHDVAYASLATPHEARPKNVGILESLLACARAQHEQRDNSLDTRTRVHRASPARHSPGKFSHSPSNSTVIPAGPCLPQS
jgi:hypothetical protein